MILQITYNDASVEKALEVARLTAPYADILEIGPVLLYAHGVKVISSFKQEFAAKKIAKHGAWISGSERLFTSFLDGNKLLY